MKQFLLGLVAGACLLAGIYFFLTKDQKVRVDIGRLLDLDYIYMKDGSLIKGWLLRRDSQNLLIETAEGSFTLPASACAGVNENVFQQFVAAAI